MIIKRRKLFCFDCVNSDSEMKIILLGLQQHEQQGKLKLFVSNKSQFLNTFSIYQRGF